MQCHPNLSLYFWTNATNLLVVQRKSVLSHLRANTSASLSGRRFFVYYMVPTSPTQTQSNDPIHDDMYGNQSCPVGTPATARRALDLWFGLTWKHFSLYHQIKAIKSGLEVRCTTLLQEALARCELRERKWQDLQPWGNTSGGRAKDNDHGQVVPQTLQMTSIRCQVERIHDGFGRCQYSMCGRQNTLPLFVLPHSFSGIFADPCLSRSHRSAA